MIIQSKKVWFNEKFEPLQIEIDGSKIKSITEYGVKKVDVDYEDKMIIPGLVDIHTHGWNGCDMPHANKEWFKQWRKYMVTEGVTSFLPTTATNAYDEILNGLKEASKAIEESNEGANVLGFYSEGPFVSKTKSGAQPVEWMLVPTKEIIDDFQKASNNKMKLIMLAPEELNGNYDVIEYIASLGIRISIGHTAANYQECEAAIKAGATSFTHTFNGMPTFKNRDQGPVASAMYHKNLYAELIGDGIHVDNVTAKIFADIKGKDKLITVTDSTRTKGFPVGKYTIFNRNYNVTEEGVCRLDNGGLSGSCKKIAQNLKNEIENIGIDLTTAINSCTINPLRMLGIENKGLLQVGYDADITILDENYNAYSVILNGKKEF